MCRQSCCRLPVWQTKGTRTWRTLTHVKQVLLWAARRHSLRHVLRLGLQGRQHLGVDLLCVHVRRHLSRFRSLTFDLWKAAYVKGSCRRETIAAKSFYHKVSSALDCDFKVKHYCFFTLLYEHGLSVIAPVFPKVAPLVIGLIYRAGSYLITFRHIDSCYFTCKILNNERPAVTEPYLADLWWSVLID